MKFSRHMMRSIPKFAMLVVAVIGSYSASGFVTPSSTYQSARFAGTQQFPRRFGEFSSPSKTNLLSQLPMMSQNVGTRKSSQQRKSSSLALFRRQLEEGNGSIRSSSPSSPNNNDNPLKMRLRRIFQVRALLVTMAQLLSRTCSRVKKFAMLFVASAAIWLGTAGSYTPPASASAVVERIMPATNDQIIDRYVQQHMFDDDDASSQDPLEAAYREAYEDYKTSGAHPRALKEITTEILGQGEGKKLLQNEEEGSLGLFAVVKGAVKFMERRIGISESTALAITAGAIVITVPSTALLVGSILSGMSRRSMDKLMKQRYGDTYTLDATIKEEPDVEAPDDDDDDDDDDDE